MNSPVENSNAPGLKPLREFPTGSPLTGVPSLSQEGTNMNIQPVICNHVWEEGICVNCGTEFAPVQQTRFELFTTTGAYKRFQNADKPNRVLRFHDITGLKYPRLSKLLSHTWRSLQHFHSPARFMKDFWLHLLGYTPVKPVAFLLLIALLYPIEAYPGFMAQAEPVHPKPEKIARDTDSRFPQKRQIIAKSDGKIVITFTNCRENNLHHVSCQFKTPDGELRWLYLPGYTLPPE